MKKLELPNVTLLGIDCINVERLQAAMDASQQDIEFGAVKLLTSLPTQDSRLVTIPHIDSIEDFSRFCIEDLHEYVDTEYVLLVQYDGFVLSAARWNPEFLSHDYIGGPIDTTTWKEWKSDIPKPQYFVGNGGFCLRSKKFLEISAKLVNEGKIKNMHPEDIALCVWYKDLLEKEGLTFAHVELAMKFSVQSDYGEYEKPFGFHGLYGENLDTLNEEHPEFTMQNFMPRIRKARLEKSKKVFEPVAIEGHYFGSMARGDADMWSDIDVWFTFKDESMAETLEKRFEYYAQVGEIIHICEPPQNAPINGVQSSVIYKTRVGLLAVDYSLCPQSTSYVIIGSKSLFGEIELPVGEIGYNPNKVIVSQSYRIDFFVSIIFGSIKKILRREENPLAFLMSEYQKLKDLYQIAVEPLSNIEHSLATLREVIENIRKVANDKQNIALTEILTFIKKLDK